MKPRRLALLDQSSRHFPAAQIVAAARALQIQCDRDFTPTWGVAATIVPLSAGEKVPAGYWPLRILDRPVGGLGIHLDRDGQPYAEIMATLDWSVTASHEMLEMLVDPFGHKFVSSPDIDPHTDHHLVQYLVEVCDPCEIWSYEIQGVAVSDFVTPEYYNAGAGAASAASATGATSAATLDHLGRLKSPLEVPRGCYISWIDPADRRWHQKQTDGSFVTARTEAHPKRNPRDDRDHAFGDADRHDLSEIRARERAAAAPAKSKRRAKSR